MRFYDYSHTLGLDADEVAVLEHGEAKRAGGAVEGVVMRCSRRGRGEVGGEFSVHESGISPNYHFFENPRNTPAGTTPPENGCCRQTVSFR